MTTHELKTWPVPFHEIAKGCKNFEVRRDDRPFEIGDTLHLDEWIPETVTFTGSWLTVEVTYIFRGPAAEQFGIKPGFCVLGIGPVQEAELLTDPPPA